MFENTSVERIICIVNIYRAKTKKFEYVFLQQKKLDDRYSNEMEQVFLIPEVESGYLSIGDFQYDPERGIVLYNDLEDTLKICLPGQDKFDIFKPETWFLNCKTWTELNWNTDIPEGYKLMEVRATRYFAQAVFESEDINE